jgi:hypothetical protein
VPINEIGNHPAPTSSQPGEYALFFIPGRIVGEVEGFFADLDEPDEYFLLVPVMRIDQLSWQPDRIKRADVRALSNHKAGVWVALSKPEQATRLRLVLNEASSR